MGPRSGTSRAPAEIQESPCRKPTRRHEAPRAGLENHIPDGLTPVPQPRQPEPHECQGVGSVHPLDPRTRRDVGAGIVLGVRAKEPAQDARRPRGLTLEPRSAGVLPGPGAAQVHPSGARDEHRKRSGERLAFGCFANPRLTPGVGTEHAPPHHPRPTKPNGTQPDAASQVSPIARLRPPLHARQDSTGIDTEQWYRWQESTRPSPDRGSARVRLLSDKEIARGSPKSYESERPAIHRAQPGHGAGTTVTPSHGPLGGT